MARSIREILFMVDINPVDYFLNKAIPITVGSALIFFFMVLLAPELFGGIYLIALYIVSVLVIAISFLLFPYIRKQNIEQKIEQQMQLFITRAGVLATSQISRKGLFDIVSEMKEYGELAREINKVYKLVDNWGIPIGDACRRAAKLSPSVVFGDFLERLAYGIEAGEEPKDFFISEQEIILEQYKSIYNHAADTIQMACEVFIALTIVMAFIILIVALIPFIIGINTTSLFILAVILFVAVEILMLYIFSAYVPRERIWSDTQIKTKTTIKIQYFFLLSLVGVLVTGLIVFLILPLFLELTFPIAMAITLTPLFFSAYYTRRKEELVMRRDIDFPSFIRSLGSTTETSSIVPVAALKRLIVHDFGPLTKNIKSLYSRLYLRIGPFRSWKYFGAETGSDLITKFSGMFIRGIKAGGKPAEASSIISFNFTKLLTLRNKRYTLATTLTGTFVGIALVISIVFFMSAGLVDILNGLVTKADLHKSYIDIQVLYPISYSAEFFVNLLFLLILFHAFVTSLIQIIVKAGHIYCVGFNFVIMVWIGAIMSKAAPWVIVKLLGN